MDFAANPLSLTLYLLLFVCKYLCSVNHYTKYSNYSTFNSVNINFNK